MDTRETARKVAIVTGASSGIGEALAWQLAKTGYHVVLAARNEEKLRRMAKELVTFGCGAWVVKTDVSVEEDCRRLVHETIEQFGRIDVLINNAGVSMRALFKDVTLDVLRKLMDVNFWGTVYCTKYALPYLLSNKGSLVGISSIAGRKGLPGRSGYAASKFAMEGFMQTIRIEHLPDGLHVMVVCPGFTSSNIRFTALNAAGEAQAESPRDESKMMSPEAVAYEIVEALQQRKRDLVLTRLGKLTVWLNKFFPVWADRQVFKVMAKEPKSPI